MVSDPLHEVVHHILIFHPFDFNILPKQNPEYRRDDSHPEFISVSALKTEVFTHIKKWILKSCNFETIFICSLKIPNIQFQSSVLILNNSTENKIFSRLINFKQVRIRKA